MHTHKRSTGWLIALALLGVFQFGAAQSQGSATLSWTPPTQNTDGSTLTDLAGYRILYGSSATALSSTVQVANPGITAYLLEGLPEGLKYFAVRAYTASGAESANSNVVSKAIVDATPPVDCAVSAWSTWAVGTWGICIGSQRTRTDTRTRVVITPPSNGGTACPTLADSQPVAEACTPVLATIGGDVFTASPNYTVFSWKTGNKLGTIKPAVKCDRNRRIAQTEFYRVPNASVIWTGTARTDYVVAACSLQ